MTEPQQPEVEALARAMHSQIKDGEAEPPGSGLCPQCEEEAAMFLAALDGWHLAPDAVPTSEREAVVALRERLVGAMPWYDESDPDYTEVDAILDAERAARLAAEAAVPEDPWFQQWEFDECYICRGSKPKHHDACEWAAFAALRPAAGEEA